METIRRQICSFLENSPYKKQIQSIALFGSYAKKKATANSDIDLLVILKDAVGYFTLVRIQHELSKTLQQEVDLVTKDGLSKYIRDDILKEAIVLYENR